jgi:2-phospho-L-lactate guanylyltransferase
MPAIGLVDMRAIVPVKNFSQAKRRLSELLQPEERKHFVHAMLEDVLRALSGCPRLGGITLLSDEQAVKDLAAEYGVDYLDERSLPIPGLNGVVQSAVAALGLQGEHEVMVIHGDLPLIHVAEIEKLIAAHRRAGVPALTIGPDGNREGTNCMICTPASSITYCYGSSSFSKHCHQAASFGASLRIVDVAGVGFDIDWPCDLKKLVSRSSEHPDSRTIRYLEGSGIADRVKAMFLDESDAMKRCGTTQAG